MRHDISYISPIKFTIERLFGSDAWYKIKECTNLSIWKKESSNIIVASSSAIERSVLIADSEWHNEAKEILNRGKELIRLAKSIDEVLAALSSTYVELSFHQLGLMPKRNRKATTNKKYWKLDIFRSVQYVQTESQKEDLDKIKREISS